MMLLDDLRTALPDGRPRVLFTDADDERVLAALAELARLGSVRPAVLGAGAAIRGRADALHVGLAGVDVIDPAALDDARRTRWAQDIATRRALEPRVASRLVARPVATALSLLADGDVDAVVAGADSHTRDVLMACELCLARDDERRVVSAAFVMDVRPAPLVFADCAVTPSPTADELADIALAAAAAGEALLGVPARVAMLSFSTHGSAAHRDVDKVVEATAIARRRRPELAIDGELQADAALDVRVAARKVIAADGGVEGGVRAAVAGHANVLVFPDLDAANIGYKLVRALVPAPALGVFIEGFRAPVVKLSRGSTVEEIVGTCLLHARRRRAGPTRAAA